MTAPAAREVTRFEANLLRILRFFLRQVPPEQGLPLVTTRAERPRCLRPDAVHLVKDSLSKGCVLYLVRAGGWRRERFLRAGKPVEGRLWERTPLAGRTLRFSKHALEFLAWVTAHRPGDKPAWEPAVSHLTVADQLLLFLAFDALRREEPGAALRLMSPFHRNALCRLAFPDDFARSEKATTAPDFKPWLTGPGSDILEALQPVLRDRWLAVERSKSALGDWNEMRRLGDAQEQVLDAFLTAADGAGRTDLVRFALEALGRLLAGEPPLANWLGGLQATAAPARLADRLDIQRRALAFLRFAERFEGWQRRATMVGYFDEEYAASQLWKADWERADGDQTAARAQALLRQLEPLRVNPAAGGA